MWVLILFIGVSFTVANGPPGGPATAEFETKEACEAGLKQIQEGFGEERPFDQRWQRDASNNTRIWTIKGVCVSKK